MWCRCCVVLFGHILLACCCCCLVPRKTRGWNRTRQMQVEDFFETHQGDIDGLRLVVLNALRETIYEQARAVNVAPQVRALPRSRP